LKLRFLSLFILSTLIITATAWADGDQALKPKTTDKCPVCGMFVAKYPDFAARIRFRDGSAAYFDGSKDMLRYYHELKRYNPAKNRADIQSILVTSYYSLKPINGLTAWYVSGSNVYGPMGHELIPFEREQEAREFMADHKGRKIYRFTEITPGLIRTLE